MNGYQHNAARWLRARACADGSCVEILDGSHEILVRSSLQPDRSIRLTPAEWKTFLDGVKQGDFD